jgi:hypothetical protein
MDVDNRLAKKRIDPSGPKGIDVDSSLNTLVTTCEVEPLAFFDFAAIVQTYLLQRSSACQEQASFQIKYELDTLYEAQQIAQLKESLSQLEESLSQLKESLSWRITVPLRWVRSLLTPIWRHRNKSASGLV